MRAVSLILLALLSATLAQESTNFNENINNAIETKPSVRLDPYIRKALLKALTELEENDNQTTESDSTEESTINSYTNSEILQTGDDIGEASPTQASKEEIQIHSFVVNGQAAFENATQNNPTFIDNNISILSTTAGNVENQVTATLPTQTVFNEIFQTRESNNNLQQVRSIPNSNENSFIDKETIPSTTTKKTITTTTTTTTTTPKPTHNDDGENIEDVDKRDVQVFQAPLVAAFTVHQDARGLPKKVVPIFQQTVPRISEPPKTINLVSQPNNSGQQLPFNQPANAQNFNVNKNPDPLIFNQQILLQKQLEEKQRALEEQLRLLQIQQRQQEELLRKQQILLQQKEAQRQQQILLDQQRQQNNVGVNNFQFQNVQGPKFQNQFPIQNPNLLRQNSQVQIQPSLSIEQTNNAPNTINHQQQLPNREAVDFLIHLRSQQPDQFPLQENHLPQGISNFLQPGSFHQGPNVNKLSPFNEQFRQTQGNRVFRQEAGVGNFGFNNQNFNRFNNFAPVNQPNRFFFNRQFPHNSDAELKQLLAQSGLSGRSHEDLNIVSKVLSLNHGIPLNNNLNNRLPFDSRRHVRS